MEGFASPPPAKWMRTDRRHWGGNRSNADVSCEEQLPRAIDFQTFLHLEKAVRADAPVHDIPHVQRKRPSHARAAWLAMKTLCGVIWIALGISSARLERVCLM